MPTPGMHNLLYPLSQELESSRQSCKKQKGRKIGGHEAIQSNCTTQLLKELNGFRHGADNILNLDTVQSMPFDPGGSNNQLKSEEPQNFFSVRLG